MTNRTPWTDQENRACVALYFAMLDAQLAGEKYCKAAMIREYCGQNAGLPNIPQDFPLYNRSKQAIEFKLMNCSAAHADIDPNAETMHSHGYRALSNYQASLKQAMREELYRRTTLEAQRFVAGLS